MADKRCPIGLVVTRESWLKKTSFVFANVRNPLNFLVSYYHHVVDGYGYINTYHYDFAAGQRGFDYLVRTILDREDKWPSRKFLFLQFFDSQGRCLVDWINRTECLDCDLEIMCSKFHIKFVPGEPRRVFKKTQSPKQYFSDALAQSVMCVYSREMNLFGYSGFDVATPRVSLKPLNKDLLSYDYKALPGLWGDFSLNGQGVHV
jgi:hypothetical protein